MNIPYAVKTGIGIFLKNFQRNIYERNWKKIAKLFGQFRKRLYLCIRN